jgi:hypothetical protein
VLHVDPDCRKLPQPVTAKDAGSPRSSLARHRPQGNLKTLRGIRRHSRASRAAFLGPAGATMIFSSSAAFRGGTRQMAGRIGTDGLPSAPALQPLSPLPYPSETGWRKRSTPSESLRIFFNRLAYAEWLHLLPLREPRRPGWRCA